MRRSVSGDDVLVGSIHYLRDRVAFLRTIRYSLVENSVPCSTSFLKEHTGTATSMIGLCTVTTGVLLISISISASSYSRYLLDLLDMIANTLSLFVARPTVAGHQQSYDILSGHPPI